MNNHEHASVLELERLNAELEVIKQTSLRLTGSLELPNVLDYIAESALALIDALDCHIFLYDKRIDQVTFGTACWRDGRKGSDYTEPRPDGLIRTVIRQAKPLYIAEATNHPLFQSTKARTWRVQAIAGIPLKRGDDVIGAFSITMPDVHEFDAREQRTLGLLADQAAIAIANAQIYQQTEKRVAELEAIRRISLQLTSSLKLTAVLDTIVDSAMQLVDATNCHIYLYDAPNDQIIFSTALWDDGRRRPAVPMPRPEGLIANVIQSGEAIVINDAEKHPLYNSLGTPHWGLKAIAGFPLKAADRVLGAFSIAFLKPHYFGQNQLRLLGLLADQATIAIENAHLYQDVLNHKEQLEERVQQRTAELQARNEELAAYDHTVAHDLKAPIALIMGYIELMETSDAPFTAEQQEFFNIVGSSARKMQNIVDELLLLSGVRNQDVSMTPLAMDIIVRESINRLHHLIREYDADIIVPDSWPTAKGYAPWVEEIWVNYISNALKYGGRPPLIHIGWEFFGTDAVKFWVRDNGSGLSEEAQGRLFVPFERLDQVQTDGHGLGLSIVQRIAQKLNGTVGVASEINVGSTFYFTLPKASETS